MKREPGLGVPPLDTRNEVGHERRAGRLENKTKPLAAVASRCGELGDEVVERPRARPMPRRACAMRIVQREHRRLLVGPRCPEARRMIRISLDLARTSFMAAD